MTVKQQSLGKAIFIASFSGALFFFIGKASEAGEYKGYVDNLRADFTSHLQVTKERIADIEDLQSRTAVLESQYKQILDHLNEIKAELREMRKKK